MNEDDQLELFPQPNKCEYPMVSAASGYRYGCRCQRCMTWKRSGNNLGPYCHIEGCTSLRLKGRRYCENHRPEKKHITRVLLNAICEMPGCDRETSWYESTLQGNVREDLRDLHRRICGRHRQPYMGVIKRHHLNSIQAIELLLVTHCTYCGEQLATLSSGKKDVVVDHDHGCCSSTSSCGFCVRGFVHPNCNTELGFLETVERGHGLEQAIVYLKQYRERNRGGLRLA